MTTRADLLARLAELEAQRRKISDDVAAAGVKMSAAVLALNGMMADAMAHLRAAIESMPDGPPPPEPRRGILFGIGREKLFTGEEGNERLSLAEAMALRNVLGIDVMRYTVDMAAVNPSPGVYLFERGTKLGYDMATMGAAGLLPDLDLRYVPPHAVLVREGEYAKQCRVCTHAVGSHPLAGSKREKFCTQCAQEVDSGAARATVCNPEHWYVEADPRSAYLEGATGPLIWNDWSDGSKGTHYAEEFEYLRSGRVPHVNPASLYAFSRALMLHFGDAIHAVNLVNEPDIPQAQYFPPWVDVVVADREGRVADIPDLRAKAARRLREEIAGPLADGIRSVSNRIKIAYPSGATSEFIKVVADGIPAGVNVFSGHPYAWGFDDPDPLKDSIKRAEGMLAVMRAADPEGRIERWFDEWDHADPRVVVGFAQWCIEQPDVGLLVFHQNRFWDEAERAKGNFVPNELGRQLIALRS